MHLEVELDKVLKIKTNGRDDTKSNYVNYPYEPTPYLVLQILANSGYINKKETMIDYGCGKGRVSFYLAYINKVNMIGIEYDDRLYNSAVENKKRAISGNRVDFVLSCASQYSIPTSVTGAYFFNPFSIQILKEVIKNFRLSKIDNNREIKLFFYYPSVEYLQYLDNQEDIIHIEDLDCKDVLNTKDSREFIAVYKI